MFLEQAFGRQRKRRRYLSVPTVATSMAIDNSGWPRKRERSWLNMHVHEFAMFKFLFLIPPLSLSLSLSLYPSPSLSHLFFPPSLSLFFLHKGISHFSPVPDLSSPASRLVTASEANRSTKIMSKQLQRLKVAAMSAVAIRVWMEFRIFSIENSWSRLLVVIMVVATPPPPNNINTAHRGRFQVNVNPIGDSK